jgi:hypothetical protein
LLLGAPGTASSQSTTLDQSFTSGEDLGASINDCCRYLAQTFTAGRSGALVAVNVEIVDIDRNLSPRLRVEIRSVANGTPTAVVLGAVVLESDSAPLSRLITFSQPIAISAGTQYAIVVSYEGAPDPGPLQTQGMWLGATGDLYPLGDLYFSRDNGSTWFGDPGFDVHFQTYVQTSPSEGADCMKGRWQIYGFNNQGQCVASIRRHDPDKP